MNTTRSISRRTAFKSVGALGACLALCPFGTQAKAAVGQPPQRPPRPNDFRKRISDRVFNTAMVDTHEHLVDEEERLAGTVTPGIPCDDWALLLSHYLNSDLVVAGMSKADLERFLSPKVDPAAKWKLIAPYWPAVRNTGYAQAVRIAIRELYGVDDLSATTVAKVQAGYERVRRTGFYQRILQDLGGIESCQVNCLSGEPFKESSMPALLMQDISIMGMINAPNLRPYTRQYASPTGIEVKALANWHGVIDWWFEHYAQYAVAVKSQQAYSRDLDYVRVPAERAEPVFQKVLQKERVTAEERKLLEDHLFWYCVDKATACQLPVKLHTGYYAGQNSMPLGRLSLNPGSAAELCKLSPDTCFVFMHIGYPHYEAMLALAKHYANAHIDMCWSWIINPLAAKDHFKKHLVTAPANKLLPFGGDYLPVEPVLGHAILARRGIALALGELVDEGWLTLPDALDLVDPILHGNARRIFRLPQKLEALKKAPWIK
jgi:predicted TIM-barrel fold metal-dependent hydrolase